MTWELEQVRHLGVHVDPAASRRFLTAVAALDLVALRGLAVHLGREQAQGGRTLM